MTAQTAGRLDVRTRARSALAGVGCGIDYALRTMWASCQRAGAGDASRLPLPPYGREVMDALAAGHAVNVRLFANRPDPWTLAKQHRHTFGPASTLVLPMDIDPLALRWPRVELIADITDLRGDVVQALAHALVRDGCRLSYLLDDRDSRRNLRVIVKAGAR